MNPNYVKNIQTANILLGDGKHAEAIGFYQLAFPYAEHVEEQIDILNVIGRSYLNLNQVKEAIHTFEQSIDLHNKLPEDKAAILKMNKAAILNNLGILFLSLDLKKSIAFHLDALEIFKALVVKSPEEFNMHLANTHLSLADAYSKKPDFYLAKKNYQLAIDTYALFEDGVQVNSLKATAFYNLGNIASDEHDMLVAKEQLTKALFLYQELVAQNPDSFRSLLAATLNNLAVIAKTSENYGEAIVNYLSAIEQYEILIEEKRNIYLPYYAATLNNLGIVYTQKHEVRDAFGLVDASAYTGFGTLSVNNFSDDKKELEAKEDKANATKYYLKALEAYRELAEAEPENYMHYIATTTHNIAVLMDENNDFEQAKSYYQEALSIRKNLADKYPNDFNADVCVTMLNMVTMNQSLLEQTTNLNHKEEAIQLLEDITGRLDTLSNQDRAVVKSMKSDVAYFKAYFEKADREYLEVLMTFGKIDELSEEINSVLAPAKKMVFQMKINQLLKDLQDKYPDNSRVQTELMNAYVDSSWLAIRSNDLNQAMEYISKGMELEPDNLSLKTNLAHYFLLKGDTTEAHQRYAALVEASTDDNYQETIDKDLQTLMRDGVYTTS